MHRGSEYIISRATFPCYFIKEQSVINHCYTEIDLKIFRQYLAPALGVTHRFVGTEPFVALPPSTTGICATGWKRRLSPHRPSNWLKLSGCVTGDADIRFPGTSTAGENDLTAIAPLVPAVTLHYLQNLLEHSRRDAAARQKTPHEKQVKMKINQPAVAGTLESGDVMIRIAPLDTQDIDLQINSSVEKQFGDAIRTTILDVLARYNVRGVQLNVDDKGALDCILRARLEALLARASGIPALPWEDCQ